MSGIEDPGEEERKRELAVCNVSSETIGLQGHIYDLQGIPLSSAENMRMQDEDGMTMPDPQQTFVLSSGRPSSTEGTFKLCMLPLNTFSNCCLSLRPVISKRLLEY
jgi:hypothetical protein